MDPLISLLVALLIAGLVIWLAQIVINIFPIRSDIKTALVVIVAIVVVLWLLRQVGVWL